MASSDQPTEYWPSTPSSDKYLLDIRTRSIEQTLQPLVAQISVLVNQRETYPRSEKAIRCLARIGQAVALAVERFVVVGETIADDNISIRQMMYDACKEARQAGTSIQRLTDVRLDEAGQLQCSAERSSMVRSARSLLNSITRVLVLADHVVANNLLASKDRVSQCLTKLEGCSSFQDFMRCFSLFGEEMVEFAHLTGDRQNELKSEKNKTQIGCGRADLERCTMMVLTSSKCCLRHPDCESARRNRDSVFLQMHRALELIQQVVSYNDDKDQVNGDSGISIGAISPTASQHVREFLELIEMTRMTHINATVEDRLNSALDRLMDCVQDFTDSPYTPHTNREKLITLGEKLKSETNLLLRSEQLDGKKDILPSHDLEVAIIRTIEGTKLNPM